MFTSIRIRVLVLVVLIVVQTGLLVWFGALPHGGSPYPETAELVDEYNPHVGERVVVYGQVVDIDPVRIRYDASSGPFVLTIRSLNRGVTEGQYLEVYGEVQENQQIMADGVVIRSERAHWYAYGISLLAGFWVLVRFVRDWRFETERLGFAPGEENA